MRFAVLVVLGACGSTQHVQTQLVDGTTGDPIARADLTVHVDARATRQSSWCQHGDSWITDEAMPEPSAAETSKTSRRVTTDELGRAQIAIPHRRGYCRYEPYQANVMYRDASVASFDPNVHEIVIPVFAPAFTDPDLEASPFLGDRAASVFSKEEAVRSVARERIRGFRDRAPAEVATLVASEDGGAYLVRSFDWTRDPWQRLSAASVLRVGDRWHVELRRLGVRLGPDGLPQLEAPSGFSSAAARDATGAWASEELAATLYRAAIDAKLLRESSDYVLPRETLVGKVDKAWEVRIASAGSPSTAAAIVYDTDRISVVRLEATLAAEAGSVTVAKLEPLELQSMTSSTDPCGDRREDAHGGPAAFLEVLPRLEASGVTVVPDLSACEPSAEDGCIVGTDRHGHLWRARCGRDVVHDEPLFTIDRPVSRTRAWRVDAPSARSATIR